MGLIRRCGYLSKKVLKIADKEAFATLAAVDFMGGGLLKGGLI